MIRRRSRGASIETAIGCHTFRATGITAYLENGGTMEHAQQIAAHESPRTTKLYDRTTDQNNARRDRADCDLKMPRLFRGWRRHHHPNLQQGRRTTSLNVVSRRSDPS